MKYYYLMFLAAALFFVACKEEEPFEYPDDPIEEEDRIIIHAERNMRASEFSLWAIDRTALQCDIQGVDPAFIEYDSAQGEFLFHLIPNDSSCILSASSRTDFLASEVSSKDWNELNFEFFFSEYVSNPSTEFRMAFAYKNVELDIDFAPYIEDFGIGESRDGTIKVGSDGNGVYVELSGNRIDPGNDGIAGNFLTDTRTGTDNYLEIMLAAEGVEQQSLVLFKYMRLFSIGAE